MMAESVIQSPESVGSWPLSAGCFSDVGPRSLSAPYWPVWVRVTLARSKSENLEGRGSRLQFFLQARGGTME